MDYLKYLTKEIHSTVMATVDENTLPVTCAIDIMDYDENGLYFLTARGKNFYARLKTGRYVSLTGMKDTDTLSCIAISVRGKVEEVGNDYLNRLFEKTAICTKSIPQKSPARLLPCLEFMTDAENGLTFQKNLLIENLFHLETV